MTQNIDKARVLNHKSQQQKDSLRAYFAQKRKLLNRIDVRAAELCADELYRAVAEKRIPEFEAVASYVPINSEMPLNFLALQELIKLPVYLPSIQSVTDDEHELSWFEAKKEVELLRTTRGTLEPKNIRLFSFADRKETNWLVLVPALAVALAENSEVYRLGYGGGYYDRFLSKHNSNLHSVAVAYSGCCVSHLPRDPWDALLNGVLTEKNYFQSL
jgi:5-formyltetrahydrofolate cyclo-ligase